MLPDWLVLTATVLLAVASLWLGMVALGTRRGVRRDLDDIRAEQVRLRLKLEELERHSVSAGAELVITDVPERPAASSAAAPAALVVGTVPPGQFTDLVLRDTVVMTASWLSGVRRALGPEGRNRIGFAMRQETKRSRKARKAELRAALRNHRIRQRGHTEGAA